LSHFASAQERVLVQRESSSHYFIANSNAKQAGRLPGTVQPPREALAILHAGPGAAVNGKRKALPLPCKAAAVMPRKLKCTRRGWGPTAGSGLFPRCLAEPEGTFTALQIFGVIWSAKGNIARGQKLVKRKCCSFTQNIDDKCSKRLHIVVRF
jgi:hypothetical protein